MNQHASDGPEPVIDFNADVGESQSPAYLATTDAVIGRVTSVNIACGGHAGNETSMRRAIRVAARHGVAIGAHPSFPDRAGFGRTRVDMSPAALRESIADQIGTLAAIAHSEGVSLSHCKPHGALYHVASADEAIARAIYDATIPAGLAPRLVGQAGSRAVELWRTWGASVAEEAFADRGYDSDGRLLPRGEPGAVIMEPASAAEQAVSIACTCRIRSTAGTTLALRADTLCIHSDTPNAGAIAARVATSLREAGVALRSLR